MKRVFSFLVVLAIHEVSAITRPSLAAGQLEGEIRSGLPPPGPGMEAPRALWTAPPLVEDEPSPADCHPSTDTTTVSREPAARAPVERTGRRPPGERRSPRKAKEPAPLSPALLGICR